MTVLIPVEENSTAKFRREIKTAVKKSENREGRLVNKSQEKFFRKCLYQKCSMALFKSSFQDRVRITYPRPPDMS